MVSILRVRKDIDEGFSREQTRERKKKEKELQIDKIALTITEKILFDLRQIPPLLQKVYVNTSHVFGKRLRGEDASIYSDRLNDDSNRLKSIWDDILGLENPLLSLLGQLRKYLNNLKGRRRLNLLHEIQSAETVTKAFIKKSIITKPLDAVEPLISELLEINQTYKMDKPKLKHEVDWKVLYFKNKLNDSRVNCGILYQNFIKLRHAEIDMRHFLKNKD